jgi:hypothetical protein
MPQQTQCDCPFLYYRSPLDHSLGSFITPRPPDFNLCRRFHNGYPTVHDFPLPHSAFQDFVLEGSIKLGNITEFEKLKNKHPRPKNAQEF